MQVTCTECDKVLKVPDSAAGKKVKCPTCQPIVAVPAAADALALQPDAEEVGFASVEAPSHQAERTAAVDMPGPVAQLDMPADIIPDMGGKQRRFHFPWKYVVIAGTFALLGIGGNYLWETFQQAKKDGIGEGFENFGGGSKKKKKKKGGKSGTKTPSKTAASKKKPAQPRESAEKRSAREKTEKFEAAMAMIADPVDQAKGIRSLQGVGPAAVPMIDKVIDEQSPEHRVILIRVLGRIYAPETVPVLARLLSDKNRLVRAEAIKNLGTKRAVAKDEILKALKSEDPNVRGGAAEAAAIARLMDADTLIEGMLSDKSATVRRSAVIALTSTQLSRKEFVPALVKALADKDFEVAFAASAGLSNNKLWNVLAETPEAFVRDVPAKRMFLLTRAMLQSHAKQAGELVVAKLAAGRPLPDDEDIKKFAPQIVAHRVPTERLAAIEKVVSKGKPKSRSVIPYLAIAVVDKNLHVRQAAIVALKSSSDKYTYLPLIWALADPEPTVAVSAMDVLVVQASKIKDELKRASESADLQRRTLARAVMLQAKLTRDGESVVAALSMHEPAKDERLPHIRGLVARSLSLSKYDGARSAIKSALGHAKADPMEKVLYAGALVRLGDRGQIDELKKGLKARTIPVRVLAARQLGELKVKSAVDELLKTVAGRDRDVKIAALLALRDIGDPSMVPALAGMIGKAKEPLKSMIVSTLGTLGPEAEDRLVEQLDSKSVPDRIAAIGALGTTKTKSVQIRLAKILSSDTDPRIVRSAAYDALKQSTGRDLGFNGVKWMRSLDPQAKYEVDVSEFKKAFHNGFSVRYPPTWKNTGNRSSYLPAQQLAGSPQIRLRVFTEQKGSQREFSARYKSSDKAAQYHFNVDTREIVGQRKGKQRKDVTVLEKVRRVRSIKSETRGTSAVNIYRYTFKNSTLRRTTIVLIGMQQRVTINKTLKLKQYVSRIVQLQLSAAPDDFDYYKNFFEQVAASLNTVE